ncbi:MAG: hypothetical protein V7K35_09730 [Nostoc sp.]
MLSSPPQPLTQAAVNNGAVGVRIDLPNHISTVQERLQVPISGL